MVTVVSMDGIEGPVAAFDGVWEVQISGLWVFSLPLSFSRGFSCYLSRQIYGLFFTFSLRKQISESEERSDRFCSISSP
ncbi:hypothetical protein AAC387_Pa08g2290 [Persea americana]